MQAISAARSSGTNVAFSLGSSSAMKKYPGEALEIIAQSDLVVGNMLEWSSLLEIQGKAGTISELRALCPTMIATMGGAGVEIFHEGELTTIPPVPCTPKNATGAGDVFLGSILYSLVHSRNVLDAAYEATSLASRSVAEGFEQLLLSLRESR
jgi:sugar/nucleoside kinase (ribokinase family)